MLLVGEHFRDGAVGVDLFSDVIFCYNGDGILMAVWDWLHPGIELFAFEESIRENVEDKIYITFRNIRLIHFFLGFVLFYQFEYVSNMKLIFEQNYK